MKSRNKRLESNTPPHPPCTKIREMNKARSQLVEKINEEDKPLANSLRKKCESTN